MPQITTREQFAEACLQRLGKPLIPIQVSPEQLDLCVSEALQYFHTYHSDANFRIFLKKQVGANKITLSTNVANTFTYGEKVIGQTSNVQFTVYDYNSSNNLYATEYLADSLTIGETIVGQESGASAIVSSSVPMDDINNHWIHVPENVISIYRLLPFSSKVVDISMFDIRYQIMLNDVYSFANGTMDYYVQVKQHLSMLEQVLVGEKGVRFNRMMNKCFLDMAWDRDVKNGDWLILESYIAINPDIYTEIYNDYVFQRLATSIIKKQWGQNLSLYSDISLPGGVKLDGDKIYNSAVQELMIAEQEFQSKYEKPMCFFMA